jgi:hypothetical protein
MDVKGFTVNFICSCHWRRIVLSSTIKQSRLECVRTLLWWKCIDQLLINQCRKPTVYKSSDRGCKCLPSPYSPLYKVPVQHFHDIFRSKLVCQTNQSGLLVNIKKNIFDLLPVLWDIYVYSNVILGIWRIHTVLQGILRKGAQFHSVFSEGTQIHWQTRTVKVCPKIYLILCTYLGGSSLFPSGFLVKKQSFVPPIQRRHTVSFPVFDKGPQINPTIFFLQQLAVIFGCFLKK